MYFKPTVIGQTGSSETELTMWVPPPWFHDETQVLEYRESIRVGGWYHLSPLRRRSWWPRVRSLRRPLQGEQQGPEARSARA
jgi:hypothetical protein